MPMMNSEARKRAQARLSQDRVVQPHPDDSDLPTGAHDPRVVAARLADRWDAEADAEDAHGNGFAAVILHSHARELRSALFRQVPA